MFNKLEWKRYNDTNLCEHYRLLERDVDVKKWLDVTIKVLLLVVVLVYGVVR